MQETGDGQDSLVHNLLEQMSEIMPFFKRLEPIMSRLLELLDLPAKLASQQEQITRLTEKLEQIEEQRSSEHTMQQSLRFKMFLGQEVSDEGQILRNNVADTIYNRMGIEVTITMARLLRSAVNKRSRILFEVEDAFQAAAIVEFRRCLKGTCITIMDDLSPEEQAHQNKMWPLFVEAKTAGRPRTYFIRSQLFIEGKLQEAVGEPEPAAVPEAAASRPKAATAAVEAPKRTAPVPTATQHAGPMPASFQHVHHRPAGQPAWKSPASNAYKAFSGPMNGPLGCLPAPGRPIMSWGGGGRGVPIMA